MDALPLNTLRASRLIAEQGVVSYSIGLTFSSIKAISSGVRAYFL